MAQYRQSGVDRFGGRGQDHQLHYGNGAAGAGSEHVSIGVRGLNHKQPRSRRLAHKGAGSCKISIGGVVFVLCLVLALTVLAYTYVSRDKEINADNTIQDDDFKNDFLTNVSRINTPKVKFGHGSVTHGRDSRYWDGDDRRRDDDYNEDVVDKGNKDEPVKSSPEVKDKATKKLHNGKTQGIDRHGLYNEAGRNELKMYEEKYEASLKNVDQTGKGSDAGNQVTNNGNMDLENGEIDVDDEYDDGVDSHHARTEEDEDKRHYEGDSALQASHSEDNRSSLVDAVENRNMIEKSSQDGVDSHHARTEEDEDKKHYEGDSALQALHSEDNRSSLVDVSENHNMIEKSSQDKSLNTNAESGNVLVGGGQPVTKSSQSRTGKKRRRHKASCEVKFLNSTAQLVEPLESRKFSRFSLQYSKIEAKPDGVKDWEPRFAGHQSLQEREDSFVARDQKINCGFIRGPPGSPSTGFDLAEADSQYMSQCHIAVLSCIFGNSDRLRSPAIKLVSRLSRKNVCFVMFMDETTLQTLTSEGQVPDRMGFVGLWKIVVVKNLPYDDMRRVGKIPKLLPHRLFPSARYSIWLDSKLRLQRDPLLILEYFLWRKGYEFSISDHYDRHCVWEEVERNKKLNKYNHTLIDQQFAFYQADGLKRFNASDPQKLLPSNVPEGSFIIRAHTPMSNLFSCLWFNEVDRFTPRDQISFAHTFHKLRKKNPTKPFYLHMFKDCERRTMAKLFHHRAEEKHVIPQEATV